MITLRTYYVESRYIDTVRVESSNTDNTIIYDILVVYGVDKCVMS